ncbi:MAG: SH3 domain-containing protein [Clostridia bacterium]|nr:SH3 domain-containing protein [Clostridia bacterium]
MAKRIISIVLTFALLLSVFSIVASASKTNYPIGGTVKTIAGALNIRKSATTESSSIGKLYSGDTVTVLGEKTGSKVEGSTLWYKIELPSGEGYVHSEYITLNDPEPESPSASDDPEFEKYLDEQGFPESYRPMLRNLHAKYPNWKFTALNTGLDWNTVVNEEYFLGDSLIEKTSSPSWKSYDQGRYNFSKSEFVTFDGGAYHSASREYLMYCLDPRNFLTETNALMFFVAYGQDGETIDGIQRILNNINWAKSYPVNDEVVYIYKDGTYDIVVNNGKEDTSSNDESSKESSSEKSSSKESSKDASSNKSSSAETSSKSSKAKAASSLESKETSTSSEKSTSSAETSSNKTFSNKTSSKTTSSKVTSSDATSSENEEFKPKKPVKEKIVIDSYAKAFYAAHKLTGISAYMMASRIRQEQGTNGNKSGMGKVEGYEGYYNLWNINTSGTDKFVQGAQYAKKQGWNTPLKSIMGGSSWLEKRYFKTGQDTLYMQKYDVVDGGNGYYWHEYMTYLPAPWLEATILKLAFTEETIKNEAVFKIPIYKNMPSKAVPCPTTNGTNNNYLQSISIGGIKVPNFDTYKQSYTDIVISNPTSTIEVKATPYDTGATVKGDGELKLKFGVNNIGIEVTASNGSVRKYTLKVVLNEGPAQGGDDPDPDKPIEPEYTPPTIETTTLQIGSKYITKIEPGTSVKAFIKALAVKNGTVKVQDGDKKTKANDKTVATGDTVIIYDSNGEKNVSYKIVIYGDVNSDGKVNSIDLLRAQRNIVGAVKLTAVQKEAADSNKDGKLNSVDLLRTQRYIVGITKSIQGE